MAADSEMLLWHTVLQRQRNYVHSCIGDFITEKTSAVNKGTEKMSAPYMKRRKRRELQLCLATQDCVELYDVSNGSLEMLGKWPITALILSMSKLNFDKCEHTILAMISDSGNLSFWQFEKDVLSGKVYQRTLANEPMSNPGIYRFSAQYQMCAEEQGRCLFLSGVERSKLCVLTDWQHGKLVVSSPIDLRRHDRITLQTVSCDVQLDNPVSANIEIEADTGDCYLAYYMMDLGLNSLVLRKEHLLEDRSISFILACPQLQPYHIKVKSADNVDSDAANPFVLCGYDGYLTLVDLESQYKISVQIPVRKDTATTTIVNGTVHKLKREFLILVQSNHGDLYKVSVAPDSETSEPVLEIAYFDTVPLSENIHIFKTGTLFNVAEFGTSYLAQFENLGEDLEKCTSHTPGRRIFLNQAESLSNLTILDSLRSLNPLTSFHVTDSTPLTVLAADNMPGQLTKLTSAVNFEELISTPLPSIPIKMWTVKIPKRSTHSLLFLSQKSSTTILKVRSGTVEDFDDKSNPFIKNKPCLFVGSMNERSIVQVMNDCVLQVLELDDMTYEKRLEWLPPAGVSIVAAFCNQTQLVVALSNLEVCYFEIARDSLKELQERLEVDVLVNSIGLLPGMRSSYCVLACDDSSLQVINLQTRHPEFFTICSMQSLMSKPHSLVFMKDNSDMKIHVGLKSGVYISSRLNLSDGAIFDVRTRFIGSKPVNVCLIADIELDYTIDDDEDEEDSIKDVADESTSFSNGKKITTPVVVLNSSVTWLTYENDKKIVLRPLQCKESSEFKTISSFITEDINHNGCCSITHDGQLLIGRLDGFLSWSKWFNEERCVVHDMNTTLQDTSQTDSEDEVDETSKCEFTTYSGQKIVSENSDPSLCYTVMKDTQNGTVLSVMRDEQVLFTENGKAHLNIITQPFQAVCSCNFGTTAKYLVLSTPSETLCVVQIRVKNNVLQAQLIHETIVGAKVHSLLAFADKVACCIGNNIILLSLGKRQLLRKSVTPIPPHITGVTCLAQWEAKMLAVGDLRESVTIFQFNESENIFESLADDNVKRHVVSMTFLDESTIIGGDKFGNCWVLRVNYDDSSRVASNVKTCKYSLDAICHIFVNDTPIQFSLVKGLNFSDRPVILWAGLQGTIGCFVPLITKKEQQIFQSFQSTYFALDAKHFEEHNTGAEADPEGFEGALDENFSTVKRDNETEPAVEGVITRVGRELLQYRSYYFPVKNVVDGDTLEQLTTYRPSDQKWIASKMKLAGGNLETFNKYINDMRTNYL